MREAVINVGVAVDHDRRRRLCDRDGYRVVLVGVVRAAGERPARRAARGVGEARAQGQAAARRGQIAGHTDDYAGRAMCRCIVGAREARHRDRRVCLVDHESVERAFGIVVARVVRGKDRLRKVASGVGRRGNNSGAVGRIIDIGKRAEAADICGPVFDCCGQVRRGVSRAGVRGIDGS